MRALLLLLAALSGLGAVDIFIAGNIESFRAVDAHGVLQLRVVSAASIPVDSVVELAVPLHLPESDDATRLTCFVGDAEVFGSLAEHLLPGHGVVISSPGKGVISGGRGGAVSVGGRSIESLGAGVCIEVSQGAVRRWQPSREAARAVWRLTMLDAADLELLRLSKQGAEPFVLTGLSLQLYLETQDGRVVRGAAVPLESSIYSVAGSMPVGVGDLSLQAGILQGSLRIDFALPQAQVSKHSPPGRRGEDVQKAEYQLQIRVGADGKLSGSATPTAGGARQCQLQGELLQPLPLPSGAATLLVHLGTDGKYTRGFRCQLPLSEPSLGAALRDGGMLRGAVRKAEIELEQHAVQASVSLDYRHSAGRSAVQLDATAILIGGGLLAGTYTASDREGQSGLRLSGMLLGPDFPSLRHRDIAVERRRNSGGDLQDYVQIWQEP